MTITTKLFGPGREVDLTVYVYTRPHMRDESLEYELHMGRRVLEGIFDEMKEMPEVTEVFFSFPENWTNIIEQRVLYKRLGKYCPNLKKVTIKTQSVYIIQCTNKECVKIMTFPDLPTPSEGDEGHLWLPMTGNVINANKLNVFSGG
jgi:hypothetical protein